VDDMSTAQIFEYFNGYKPFEIEWINDKSCNVVWKDTYLLSLAIIELSKPYANEEEGEVKEEEKEEKVNDDEEVEEVKPEKLKVKLESGKWRIGIVSKQGNQIFMRYAKSTDKKIKGAESRSEYYRKYGNPNYNNMRGLISNSKKTKIKSDIFKKYMNNDYGLFINSLISNINSLSLSLSLI
jgi:hypothetical protein